VVGLSVGCDMPIDYMETISMATIDSSAFRSVGAKNSDVGPELQVRQPRHLAAMIGA
jgi:hypothetical protein